jgi:hypothetical protein
MDLAALEPAEGATIALRHPVSNEPLVDDKGPLTIDIVGVDSPKFQARQRLLTNKRLATSGNRKSKLTAEDLEEEGIATVAACITGWSANIELDKKPLEFSRANAKLLITRLRWIGEQVDLAIADRANFLKASPTS